MIECPLAPCHGHEKLPLFKSIFIHISSLFFFLASGWKIRSKNRCKHRCRGKILWFSQFFILGMKKKFKKEHMNKVLQFIRPCQEFVTNVSHFIKCLFKIMFLWNFNQNWTFLFGINRQKTNDVKIFELQAEIISQKAF